MQVIKYNCWGNENYNEFAVDIHEFKYRFVVLKGIRRRYVCRVAVITETSIRYIFHTDDRKSYVL